MKTLSVLFAITIGCGGVCKSTAQSQPGRTIFFSSNQFPPPHGLYVAAPGSSIGSPVTGLTLSNLVLRGLSPTIPPPPPNTSATLTFQSQAELDLISPAGGFQHVTTPVELTVQVTPGGAATGGAYSLVLLEFSPQGQLLGNLKFRQSASLTSSGQLTITTTAGGFWISTSFDLNLDGSPDGGQTWIPLSPALHIDLRADPSDPIQSLPYIESTPLFPAPDDQLVSFTGGLFTGGVRIRGFRQTLFSTGTDISSLTLNGATPVAYTGVTDLEFSTDGGTTFTHTRTVANCIVVVAKLEDGSSQLFDTELTQMDFTVTMPGAGLMFRESPTLSSFGGAGLVGFADGSVRLSSFFDVFLEVSTDGGQTWNALNNGPLHLQSQQNSGRNQFASSNLPTPGGQYVLGPTSYQFSGRDGAIIAGDTFTFMGPSAPPPDAGQQLVQNFTAQVNMRISLDGGATFTDAGGTAAGRMLVTRSALSWGGTSYYDTEMLQLDVTGLPGGVMLRESPTLASRGRLSITPIPGGAFKMDSFFDVFTELSLDSGQTWTTAPSAVVAALTPSPGIVPLHVSCPGDFSVVATGNSGAVVSYPPLLVHQGDCPLLPIADTSFSPPDGSLLPIGTTTVTANTHNGCGEHFTCSFKVTVLPSPSILRQPVFAFPLLPPTNGMLIEPGLFGSVSMGQLVVSNFSLVNFTRSATPPAPGTSLTLDTAPTVVFDWSTDGGQTFTHGRAPVRMVLNLQNLLSAQPPAQQSYGLDLVRFDVAGGDLPTGVLFRMTPASASTGQATIAPIPAASPGTSLIGLSLNLFLDGSTDNGHTWVTGDSILHLELRVDPGTLLPVQGSTPLQPPPMAQLASPPGTPVIFTGGIRVRNLRHQLFGSAFELTLSGASPAPLKQQFSSVLDLELSLDGGISYFFQHTQSSQELVVQPVQRGAYSVFDLQLVRMDVSGGGLPPTIMLRASSTFVSGGGLSLQGFADGSYQSGGFIDAFLDLSTDGGQTWQAALNGPVHLELQGNSEVMRFTSSNLPPSGSELATPSGQTELYPMPTGQIIAIRNEVLSGFTGNFPPPAPGQSRSIDFRGTASLELSTDGGVTFNPYTAPASASMTLTGNSNIDWGDRQFIDTQLRQLTIAGGNLPTGYFLRQNPAVLSPGRIGIAPDPLGGYRIESFSGMSQQLSVNGGQNWNTAVLENLYLLQGLVNGFVPYRIFCPADITVQANSASGAIVDYGLFGQNVPDCPFCCPTVVFTPPSGSLFPIGTTTVVAQGHNGCGEHPTCSFTVTVLPPSGISSVAATFVGNAIGHFFHGGTGDPISMIISNIGSSGLDGVHLATGSAESLTLNFADFSPTEITDAVFSVTGPFGTNSQQLLGTSTFQADGPDLRVKADFSSIGSTGIVVKVWDENHNSLFSQQIDNLAWFDLNNILPPPCSNANKTTCTVYMGPDFICYKMCIYGCNCQGTNCWIERVSCLQALSPASFTKLTLSGLDFTVQAAHPPGSLTISTVEIGKFGNRHVTTGNATFETDSGLLVADSIGGTGGDGMDINLNRIGKLDVMLSPLRLFAPNALLTLTGSGDVNGLPAVQFGSLSFGGDGGIISVRPDFSGAGGTQSRVEVYRDSVLQGNLVLGNGEAGTLTISGNLITDGTFGPVPGFFARFDAPFTFNANGLTLSGDELRISAADPSSLVGGLTQFSMQGANIGEMAIVAETVTPLLRNISFSQGGGIRFSGQGVPGALYRLEATSDLSGGTGWRTAASAVAEDDGYFELSDFPTGSQQFYRAVTP